jgi:hypothetical protein
VRYQRPPHHPATAAILSNIQNSAMSKWTIHIGPGKTGTTFLQNIVLGQCDDIVVAGRPNNKRPEYQKFYHAVTREEDEVAALATIKSFVEAQASSGKPVVLSDETLALAPMWTVVADRLAGVVPEANILLTIRNQLTAIPSYYSNHGRSLMNVPDSYRGRFVGLAPWFDHAVRNGQNDYIKALDYRALASTFLRYFPDRVHVLTYETMIKDKTTFGDQFSDLIGADIRGLMASTARVNPRQSTRALHYQKLRSKLMPSVHFTKLPFVAPLRPLAERFLKGGASIEVDLSDEQKSVIRYRYAASNAWMQEHFSIDLERQGYPL